MPQCSQHPRGARPASASAAATTASCEGPLGAVETTAATILIAGGAADHRENAITVADRIGQSL